MAREIKTSEPAPVCPGHGDTGGVVLWGTEESADWWCNRCVGWLNWLRAVQECEARKQAARGGARKPAPRKKGGGGVTDRPGDVR